MGGKMKKCFALLLLMLMVAAVPLLAGCGKQMAEADVDYAAPMVDNLLVGIKDRDLQVFSKDMGSKMIAAFTQASFDSLADTLSTKIGDYQSRAFASARVTKSGETEFTVVIYKAKYSSETDDVLITVSFGEEEGAKKITGLYFNSPNLRK
jgi:hypothetical protein